MTVYITSAKRAYAIADAYRARGVHVCLGGLHPTSLPDEAAQHADTIFLGPGEETWPRVPAGLPSGPAGRAVRVVESRTLEGAAAAAARPDRASPLPLPELDRRLARVPASLRLLLQGRVLRGRPLVLHASPSTRRSRRSSGLPGRHLYFLDDHLLGNRRFAEAFFAGMRGMGRVFQGASTVDAILHGDLIERAAEAGMRSVFVGFETLDPENLRLHAKRQNLARSYDDAIRRCHDLGVMINGSFVFGLDDDGPDVFARTVEWAVVAEHRDRDVPHHDAVSRHRSARAARAPRDGSARDDWDLYDTRHVVYRAARHDAGPARRRLLARVPRLLLAGRRSCSGARGHDTTSAALRHLLYAGGWKKFEPLWDTVIRHAARHRDAAAPRSDARLLRPRAAQRADRRG